MQTGTRRIYNDAFEVDLKAKRERDSREACLKSDFSEFVIAYHLTPCVEVLEAPSFSENFECKDIQKMLLGSGRRSGLLLGKSACGNYSVVTS